MPAASRFYPSATCSLASLPSPSPPRRRRRRHLAYLMGQSQSSPSARNRSRSRSSRWLDLGFMRGQRPRPGGDKRSAADWLRCVLSPPLPAPTEEAEEEAEAEGRDAGSREEQEVGGEEADHLVVMVNGLYGSSADWKFAAEQFVKRQLGKVFIHRSQSNHSKLTYDGVDIMGERLAEEVRQVVQRKTNLRKISFVAHSLGGLVTRYAIGKLYEPSMSEVSSHDSFKICDEQKTPDVGKIAGLEPINFITSATPHLGSRWNKQLPFLFGIPIVEKMAAETAHFIVGRTGKHLFLTDRDDGKSPLLLRMVEDCDEGKFMSALRSFKRRVAYANITYDHIVGWRTSSIRRQHELPKLKLTAHDKKYPHIVNVEKGNAEEYCSRNSEDCQQEESTEDSLTDNLEELMIRGLTQVTWERVDVCIHDSRLRYNAHNNIQQIEQEMGKHSDGKDVEVGVSYPLVAVCIDKDKNSQNALKYATETLVHRGQTIVLVHVNTKGNSGGVEDAAGYKQPTDPQMKDLFLPFRCFCTRKDIQCKDVVLDDHDVAKSIVEFAAHAAIEKLVLGATARGGFVRFKADISSSISKTAPDFCTVYIVTKGSKVTSVRQAIRQAPSVSPLRTMIQGARPEQVSTQKWTPPPPPARGDASGTPSFQENHIMSPFSRTGLSGGSARKAFPEFSLPESSDISFIGGAPGAGGRTSTERFPLRLSTGSDSHDQQQHSFEASRTPSRWGDSFGNDSTSHSQTSTSSWSSLPTEDMESEMKRLRLELKQTMDMYSTACKEALTAKQKAMELQRWKVEEEQRTQESRFTEESAMALIEQEKAKARAAIEAAEAAQRLADFEAQKRISAEMKALKEAEERLRSMGPRESAVRYRRYTIEEIEIATDHFNEARKVGEGGYGPVFKGHLDHTPVAIKVLRPDAAQGRSQFQQEVEVLSCIRHPNMVLLLGACPEYGCLVYEYMANGSLDDCLFRRGGGGPVIPWQHRFRIAAEIATGLLFLHQTKPEPLVHRDLKPGNILLDRNYVSKISDVGLARLVPPSVADSVTQCHMTSAAGTFCYIDPEYQQTGMLGVKSDVYSLGVMLLQIVTARPPMGLTHHVGRALEHGTMADLLDHSVHDWPVEEAIRFAEISLRCCELRRKDRPDLATVVLPELNRLRALGEDNMQFCGNLSGRGSGMNSSPFYSNSSYSQQRHDGSSDPMLGRPHYSSNSNQSAMPGRRPNYN